METFGRLVYMRTNNNVERVMEYIDEYDIRSDFIHMTTYDREDYQYVIWEEVITNYSDYEEIRIIDAWYADEE